MFRCMLCMETIEDELWILETIFELTDEEAKEAARLADRAEASNIGSDVLTVCAKDREKVRANSKVVLNEQHWKRV